MALRLWALTLLGLLGAAASLRSRKLDFFRSERELNHLAVDEASGVVYLGAVNALYQLDAKLQLEQQVATGPALDNKKCTPPIEASQCHEAEMTDNVNQLLLLDPPRKRLVECGSLFKGICALRALSNISLRLFYEDGSGEKSFVASNDEGVATVGLVSSTGPGDRVLFVGKGNGPHDNGIIVSTRLLDRTDSREAFEAYTDHATYKAGYLSTNTQQFVAAFEDGPYVFFVFNQQDKHPAQNRTLLARMCREDPNYYSYLEMDLQCRDPDANAAAFGTCLAASVAAPGSGRVLYAAFSRDGRSSGGPGAGLCLFPLDEVHAKMEANRNACYTGTWESSTTPRESRDIFYKPFHGEILCGGHAPVWASVCSCGARTAGVCVWVCVSQPAGEGAREQCGRGSRQHGCSRGWVLRVSVPFTLAPVPGLCRALGHTTARWGSLPCGPCSQDVCGAHVPKGRACPKSWSPSGEGPSGRGAACC